MRSGQRVPHSRRPKLHQILLDQPLERLRVALALAGHRHSVGVRRSLAPARVGRTQRRERGGGEHEADHQRGKAGQVAGAVGRQPAHRRPGAGHAGRERHRRHRQQPPDVVGDVVAKLMREHQSGVRDPGLGLVSLPDRVADVDAKRRAKAGDHRVGCRLDLGIGQVVGVGWDNVADSQRCLLGCCKAEDREKHCGCISHGCSFVLAVSAAPEGRPGMPVRLISPLPSLPVSSYRSGRLIVVRG